MAVLEDIVVQIALRDCEFNKYFFFYLPSNECLLDEEGLLKFKEYLFQFDMTYEFEFLKKNDFIKNYANEIIKTGSFNGVFLDDLEQVCNEIEKVYKYTRKENKLKKAKIAEIKSLTQKLKEENELVK